MSSAAPLDPPARHHRPEVSAVDLADGEVLHVTRHTVVSYAFGSVGTGLFATVPGLVLLYFLTDTLGVAAGVASLVVTLPKAWDVLAMPVVGRMSDQSAARVRSRLPFLRLAWIVLPITFVLMFAVPPAFGPGLAAAWVFVGFLLASTAFAVFQVPYIAMSAELTDDPPERSTLMAWRVAFLTVAILVGGALAPVVRDAFGGANLGHLVMAVFMATLMFIGIWLCIRGLARARTRIAPAPEGNLWHNMRQVRGNHAFVVLLTAFLLQALATAAMLGGAQYYATYIVGDSGAVTLLFVCLVAPALLVMPFWNWVAHRFGKVNGFTMATLLFLLGTVILFIGGRELAMPIVYLAIGMCGVAYAGGQMFPLSMLPDCVAADTHRTGHARAGMFTGLWTAGETIGLSVGPGLVALVLALTGYVSSRADEAVAQPDSAVNGVLIAFTLVPAVLIAISLPFVRRYAAAFARDERDAPGAGTARPAPTSP
ncbi:MAG TPA: MFS transporter [Candidatus Nanopelagicales bacterium]